MKKILFAILIITAVHTVSKAQLSVTPHAAPAFPVKTFGNFAGAGFGFGLEGAYAINDNLSIGAAIEQYQFQAELLGLNISNFLDVKFKITPITANLRYYLPGEVLRPYVGIEAGVYNFSLDGSIGIANVRRTYFGLAPTLGVLYPINDRLDFFANTKYQSVLIDESIALVRDFSIKKNIHFIPVNVGVSFKFNH